MNHNLDYFRKIQGMNNVENRKEAEIRLIKSNLAHDFYNSIDCESATVNGTSTDLLITRSTDYTIKKVVTKPDEHVHLGDIINWCDTDWIIDTIDADDRINTHAKMRRCNVMLKWLDENGVVRAYSGFCEDATKYGEGVEGGKMMQVPDFQVKVKIRLDQHSAKINRDRRFLLDASQYLPQTEPLGAHPSAYIVTRRNVLTGNHAGSGYVELTLNECAFSAQDNPTLMIADYFPTDDVYTLTVADGTSLTVAKGGEYTLTCTATKNGTALNQSSILFATSDASVATVSADGKITGVTNGECVVTVKAGNVKQEIAITISESVAEYEIRVEPESGFDIAIGTTVKVQISIWSGTTRLPYALDSVISSGESFATISSTTPESVYLCASQDASAIGKTAVLRVSEPGRGITKDSSFKIVGWF